MSISKVRAVTAGLVGHWSLDEGSGTTAGDSSGSGNTGTLTNGPAWTTGKVGGALSFDGVNDYVNIPNSPSLNPASAMTVSAWIRPSDVANSRLAIGKTVGPNWQYVMRVGFSEMELFIGGTNVNSLVTANTWYHVAGSYDGSEVKLYLDGVLLASKAKTGSIADNGAAISIGSASGGASSFFSGVIDEVKVFNRALSTTEVQQEYNAVVPPDTTPPSIPTGLTANAISSSQINLSWNASTDIVGVTGYRVYRGGSQIGTSAGTNYNDTTLSPSTTYSYTVAAYDLAGNLSAQSGSASATTQPAGASTRLLLEDFSTLRISGDGVTPIWDGGATPYQSSRLEFKDGDMRLRTDLTGLRAPNSGYQLWFFPISKPPRYAYPSGYTQGWIKSGTWDPLVNRMEFWITCNKFIPSDLRESMNWGTYVKPTNADAQDQGSHYYHFLPPNLYPNRWAKVELSWTPTHNRDFGLHNYPADASWNDVQNFSYTTPVHYFDGLAPWYIGIDSYSVTPTASDPFTCWVDDFYLSRETGEPDAEVRNIVVTYNGAAYEVSWDGLMNSNVAYEIRYSPNSMKVNGFASGTSGGTKPSSGSAYPGVLWVSPAMVENSSGMYFAIRPTSGSTFTEIFLPKYVGGTTPLPDTQAPSVPTGLVATAISSSHINLSWTASTDNVGVTGYRVYRGGTQIATVTSGTTYSNTGLSPSTNYSYTVAAYDAAGNVSAQSGAVSAATQSTAGNVRFPFLDWENGFSYNGGVGAPSDPQTYPCDGTAYPCEGPVTPRATFSLDTTDAMSGRQSLKLVQTSSPHPNPTFMFFLPYNYGNKKTGVLSPRGFAREYADTPATYPGWPGWSTNTYNRLSFWIKAPTNGPTLMTTGQENMHLGTYVKCITGTGCPDGQSDETGGHHYYHFMNIAPTDTWTKVIFNMHPNHQRGGNGNTEWGNQPYPTCSTSKLPDGTLLGGGSATDCGVYNYWDTFSNFYIATIRPLPSGFPVTYKLDGLEFYKEPYPENDDQIFSLAGTYVPGTNRVVVTWFSKKDESTTHEVRYAYQSIHQLGWNAATPAPNGIKPAPGGGYDGIFYDTTAIPASGQSMLYIAIKPQNSNLFTQIAIPLTAGPITPPPPPPADTTPPSVPTGLSASAVSSSQINLSWTASTDNVGGTGVAGYRVYRGGTQIATTTGTTYQNTGLSPSTSYSYTVSAYDAAGNNSVQSGAVSATTQAASTSTDPFANAQVGVSTSPLGRTNIQTLGDFENGILHLDSTANYNAEGYGFIDNDLANWRLSLDACGPVGSTKCMKVSRLTNFSGTGQYVQFFWAGPRSGLNGYVRETKRANSHSFWVKGFDALAGVGHNFDFAAYAKQRTPFFINDYNPESHNMHEYFQTQINWGGTPGVWREIVYHPNPTAQRSETARNGYDGFLDHAQIWPDLTRFYYSFVPGNNPTSIPPGDMYMDNMIFFYENPFMAAFPYVNQKQVVPGQVASHKVIFWNTHPTQTRNFWIRSMDWRSNVVDWSLVYTDPVIKNAAGQVISTNPGGFELIAQTGPIAPGRSFVFYVEYTVPSTAPQGGIGVYPISIYQDPAEVADSEPYAKPNPGLPVINRYDLPGVGLIIKGVANTNPVIGTPPIVPSFATTAVGGSWADLSWNSPVASGGSSGSSQELSTDPNIMAYAIRVSQSPITDETSWNAAVPVEAVPAVFGPGLGQQYTVKGLKFSTTYYAAIRAYNQNGVGSSLSTVSFTTASADQDMGTARVGGSADTTPPSVPTGLSASAVSSSQINLSWTASTDNVGVTGYRIYRGGTQIATTATNSYQNTGLSPSTAYSYTVAAYDAAGNVSAQSGSVSATTLSLVDTIPPVISAITSTNVTTSGATITWTTNEASDTQVEYGLTTAYGFQTTLNTSLVTSHSVALSSLSAGALYHYRVKSKDAAGNLATSLDNTFTTQAAPDTQAPNAISNLSTSNVQINSFTLSWTAPSDPPSGGAVSSYDLRYSASPITSSNFSSANQAMGEPTPATPGLSQSYILAGLSPGTVYYVAIVSQDAAGNISALSNVAAATTAPAPDTTPPVISSILATSITTSAATITWTTNEASDTQVDYGLTTSYGSQTALNTSLVTAHSATLSSLQAGTLYHYRVKSKDAAGNLVVSSDQTFTTAAPPDTTPPTISNIQALTNTSGGAAISWTTNELSDSQVEYGLTTSYGSASTLDVNLVTAHAVALTSLNANTTYHFRVKSKDASGNLAQSSDQTFTTPASTPITQGPVITNVLATNITNQPSIVTKITWDTSVPATAQVEYGLTTAYGSLSALDATLLTSHSVTLSNLQRKTLYHFRVISQDSSGRQTVSADFTFTSHARLPKVPSVSGATAADGSVRLSWTNPAWYEFFRGVAILKSVAGYAQTYDASKEIVRTASQTYTDGNVTPGTTYYYTLFAYDDLGAYSDPVFVSFTPKAISASVPSAGGGTASAPLAPTIPGSFQAIGASNQIVLTWQNPVDANFVRVRLIRKEGLAPTSPTDGTVVYEGTAQEFTDTGPVPATQYYYALYALDRNLNTSPLLTASAKLGDKTDQQAIDALAKARQAQLTGLTGARGRLIRYANNPTVYLLENGQKRGIRSYAMYQHNFGSRPIATVPAAQTYPDGPLVAFGPGALLKAQTSPTVYLIISDSTKYGFRTRQEFESFGFRFSLVREVADAELQSIPEAPIGALSYHPTGQFVKYQQSPAVYKMENNAKRAIPSMDILRTHIEPSDILVIPATFQYADAQELSFAEGSLLKGSTATVYLLENGLKRPFTSAAAFLAEGYDFSQVRAAADAELVALPQGPSL